MTATFKDANFLFGGWDNKTRSWNGVVGQVGGNMLAEGQVGGNMLAVGQVHMW